MLPKIKKLVVINVIILSYYSLFAAESDSVTKYQYQAELTIDESNKIQRLLVPESIQSKLNFANASDLQIYNAEGLLLPSYAKFSVKDSNYSESVEMNYFPLYETPTESILEDNNEQIDVKLEVLLNNHIQVVKNNNDTGMNSGSKIDPVIKGFILENPQYTKKGILKKSMIGNLYQLDIHIQNEFEGIASYQLETSSDLNHWTTLVQKDAITRIRHNGQQLNKNSVTLHRRAQRYLKLTWKANNPPSIEGFDAHIGQQSEEIKYSWSEPLILSAVVEKGIANNTFELEVSPSFRADKLRLNTMNANQVISGRLLSSRDNKSWYKFSDFQFYQVSNNKENVLFNEITLPVQSNKYWRVEFSYPNKVNPSNLSFSVNRYPVELYFAPQGDGPFTVKFAADQINDYTPSLKQIMVKMLESSDQHYGTASIKGLKGLKGLNSLEIKYQEKIEWKKYLLWAALVLGVLIMIGMARSLYRQMNNGD